MSLTPRTPRNNPQRVATARPGSRKRQARPARHLRLWEAIRQTREELEQWLQRVEQVDGLFRLHILPRETRLTTVCGDLTDTLMNRYEEDSLTNARQALLALWIADNLRSLNAHPFASETQRSALSQRWKDIQTRETNCTTDSRSSANRMLSGSLSDALDEDELEEDDVIFDFGWHGSRASRGNAEDDASPDSNESGAYQHGDEASRTGANGAGRVTGDGAAPAGEHTVDAAADADATVNELEKRLSVDRLFRQLARVLHPDREQDEILKAVKHDLMSQCLQARHDKDINTLLTLYCQHIGDLPDDLSDTDHEDLVNALQTQLRQLQRELRQQRFSDPLRVQIVERYSSGDEQQTLQSVMHHAQSLDVEADHLESLRQNLDSDDSLEEALDARRRIELDRMVINQMTGYS